MNKEKIAIYDKWKLEQSKKADKFFSDPFTGVIEKENLIPYLHTMYIGGSSDAALLNLSPWVTKSEAYERMVNFAYPQTSFNLRWGTFAEEFVAREFSRATHKAVFAGDTYYGDEVGCPWAMCQIDRLLEGGIPLEIKTASSNNLKDDGQKQWGHGCEFNSEFELVHEDTQIPAHYNVQCQKQLWLANKDYMWLCCMLSFESKVRIYKIHRDESLIKQIKEAEEDFLFNHVIPLVPYKKEQEVPEVLNEEAGDDAVFATDDFISMLSELNKVRKDKVALGKQEKELSEKVHSMLAGHRAVVNREGKTLCVLTPQSRMTFDSKGLKDKYPEIYAEFYKAQTISPKLTIKEI